MELSITYAKINIDEEKKSIEDKFGITANDAVYFSALLTVCKNNNAKDKGAIGIIKHLHEQQRYDLIYYLATQFCYLTDEVIERLEDKFGGEGES